MENNEEIDLPEEYEVDEPEGFKNLSAEQQRRIIEKKREMDKAMIQAIKENRKEGLVEPAQEQKRQPFLSKIEKKGKKEEIDETRIMGKYMFRDMPLFKYELIIYLMLAFVAFFMYIIERIGLMPGALSRAVIPLAIVPIAIWFVKWLRYMPTKKKVPSLRIYKSGVLELGVENISKGYITYGSGDSKQRKYITRLNKHVEASTGKPFLITSETQGENLSLIEGTKPDMRSEEFNAILENERAVVTKNVMNKMLSSIKPGLDNPMFLLAVVQLALLAVLVVKTFGLFDALLGK